MTYVDKDITFTQLQVPKNINAYKTETQVIKLHHTNKKHLHMVNLFIPPRDTTNPHPITKVVDITTCFNYIIT